MPEANELVATRCGDMEAYLIEARSIGGLSGSPVFVNLGTSRLKDGQVHLSTRRYNFHLLGLMHGHWDVPLLEVDGTSEDSVGQRKVNMGIGIVVPAKKILEALEHPMIKKQDDEAIKKLREEYLPTTDEVSDEDDFLTPDAFQEALRRASRRTSSPDDEKEGK